MSLFKFIFLFFLAFNNSQALATKPAPEPLNIYVVGSFTGIMPFLAQGTAAATVAFVNEMNQKGGLLGRPLKVIQLDDQADLKKAGLNAATALKDKNHLVTIGHAFSSIAYPVGKMYQDGNKLFATVYATNESISTLGKFVKQVCFNDVFQAKVLATTVTKRFKAKRVVILKNEGDSYSAGLADNLVTKLIANGVITKKLSYIYDHLRFADLYKSIELFKPELIILPEIKVRAAELVQRLSAFGLDPHIKILGSDGWGSEKGTPEIFYSSIPLDKTPAMFYTYHYEPSIPTKTNLEIKHHLSKNGVDIYGPAVFAYEFLNQLTQKAKVLKTTDNTALASALEHYKYQGATGTVTYGTHHTTRPLVLLKLTRQGPVLESVVTQ